MILDFDLLFNGSVYSTSPFKQFNKILDLQKKVNNTIYFNYLLKYQIMQIYKKIYINTRGIYCNDNDVGRSNNNN